MKTQNIIPAEQNGLKVIAYIGMDMVMLCFDIEKNLTHNLAGFAVQSKLPNGEKHYLSNRLTFLNKDFKGFTTDTKPTERKWFDSIDAPFQYFRWLHVPPQIQSGKYSYEVIPMYFGEGNQKLKLKRGLSCTVEFSFSIGHDKNFEYGFTRGYLSSQAYADKFHNKDIRPAGTKTIDFNTKPFKAQYEWLGSKAHKMLFDFLKECLSDGSKLKVLMYDCDHPDFIDYLKQFKKNVKIVLDNATLHHDSKNSKPEDKVFAALKKTSVDQIVRGHFGRFQHNKVLIKMKNGRAEKVFTGSANFSIRGLYAQANNCMVITNEKVATAYSDYFDKVYALMQKKKTGTEIKSDAITQSWIDFKGTGLPKFSLCLSPHSDGKISMSKVESELKSADSSILFSIMNMGGSGGTLEKIRSLDNDKDKIFHYGIVQSIGEGDSSEEESGDYSIIKQGRSAGTVSFAYLKDKVPFPFSKEFSGGKGQIIHDKFIVIDFNSTAPVVFTGSSNLAELGEENNGDNLLAIYDNEIAVAYAVEAVRLFDHYNFRNKLKKTENETTKKVTPLALKDSDEWVKRYFDEQDQKCKDRKLFAM